MPPLNKKEFELRYSSVSSVFDSYFNAGHFDEERLTNYGDNSAPHSEFLEERLREFLEHRPINDDEYERFFGFDFDGTDRLYAYFGLVYNWFFANGPEPDLTDFLKD